MVYRYLLAELGTRQYCHDNVTTFSGFRLSKKLSTLIALRNLKFAKMPALIPVDKLYGS